MTMFETDVDDDVNDDDDVIDNECDEEYLNGGVDQVIDDVMMTHVVVITMSMTVNKNDDDVDDRNDRSHKKFNNDSLISNK